MRSSCAAHVPFSRQRRRIVKNDGFTMMEVMVTMVIMCILIAIAMPLLKSPRKSISTKTAVSAGQMYRIAISSFQLDHGNRVPIMGTSDWRVATDAQRREGPLTPTGDPYLKPHAPDAIESGEVGIGAATPAAAVRAAGGTAARLLYRPGRPSAAGAPSTTFSLEVWIKDESDRWVMKCTISDQPIEEC